MLNEEKIILMTQMASYEENEGKKNMAIGRYFRSDYIAIQVLKSVLCATIAYAVCFALFIFYDFETFMQDIYKMDLVSFAMVNVTDSTDITMRFCSFKFSLCHFEYPP